MRINIFKLAAAAAVSLALALSPVAALAADTATTGSTTTSTTTTSDPSGLGSAYNYQVPSAASATCCKGYYDHTNANENATIVMKNFNQKLAAMQLAIIESLRLGTGQLSGNMREQTGATHTLADQQDDRSTVKAVEDARLKALVSATSGTSSCYVITGATGGSLQGTVNKSTVAYSGELDKWVRGESTYSEKGQEAAEYYRLEAYCNSYATKADVKAKLCKSEGQLAGASTNAADSIFYKGDSGDSETYTKERAEATNAFIINTVAPNTYTPQTEAEAQSPEGRKQAARYKTQMARESVGRAVVTEFAKSRDPQSSGNTLVDWAKDRMSKMGMSGLNADKLSYQQWLSIYAKGFLLDQTFLTSSDQNEVTALKDIKNMMAVLNYVAFEQLEQSQKMNVQLAMQTAILNEQTRTDGIFGLASRK
jgi:hypothetical protein